MHLKGPKKCNKMQGRASQLVISKGSYWHFSEKIAQFSNSNKKVFHPDINSVRPAACRGHLGLPSETENALGKAV